MTPSDFNRPIQADVTQKVDRSVQQDKRSAERANKLQELKSQIESGNYRIDTAKLADAINRSGILND